MKIKEIQEQEFQTFVATQACNSFTQSQYNKQMAERSQAQVTLYGGYEGDTLVAATLILGVPLLGSWMKYYAPRGFVLDYQNTSVLNAFSKALEQELKRKKGLYLRLDPYLVYQSHHGDGSTSLNPLAESTMHSFQQLGYHHNGLTTGYGHDEQVRWQYWKDLNTELPLIQKQYRQNTRNKISYAKKIGSRIRVGTREQVEEFYHILQHTADRQAFQNRDLDYFYRFYDTYIAQGIATMLFVDVDLKDYQNLLSKEYETVLRKIERLELRGKETGELKELRVSKTSIEKKQEQNTTLMQTYGEHVVSACSIFLTYGNEVIYFYSGGYEELMPLAGQYFLQDYMIHTAKEQGYQRYNFFGIKGDFQDDGVYLFKSGFNGYAVEFIGQYDLILNQPMHTVYQGLRKFKTMFR
ncbi:MAG: peptidoglycan bridge formation glycyltransferase FemA/FemB family protein [Erysipelotrichaceae bacterium]